MGRHNQRRRAGGSHGVSLIGMIAADVDGSDAIVTYNAPFDPATLSPSDFVSQPSEEVADSITQQSPTQLIITFNTSISGDSTLTYTRTTPEIGLLSPQTIAYS